MSPCFVNTETRISCQGAQYFWHFKSWHKIAFLGELFQARSLVSVKVIGQNRSDDSPQKAIILKNKERLDQNSKALQRKLQTSYRFRGCPCAVSHSRSDENNQWVHSAFVSLGHVGVAAEDRSE